MEIVEWLERASIRNAEGHTDRSTIEAFINVREGTFPYF